MGTTTFVISEEGVVVYDGGGVTAMADKVIDKIRSLTALPVTHVIISHWHGDHSFGIYRYAEEYQNVQFVADEFTHDAMNGSPIDYVLGYPDFISNNLPRLQETVRTKAHPDGNAVSAGDLARYQRMIEDADDINVEYNRVKVTPPNVIFKDKLIIQSGSVRIELLNLGQGNTEGDIVMWLPDSRLVAAGDLVVLPSPYAFNVPPRPWAKTLQALKNLNSEILVPGHGAVQRDHQYVDLLIESALSIADQRDAMLKEGLLLSEIEEKLDFSAFEQKFTNGDDYNTLYFKSWFERPFRKAAIKALGVEPMVKIGPRASPQ
jgi:glyoxylase-like metal-dependent hydrolase (beta-lactamase superfamily II)